MLRKLVSIAFVFCAALTLVLTESAQSQCTPPQRRAYVAVNDNGSGKDTIWFGHDPSAEYGLDTDLCEVERPPIPPAGVFDIRSVNIDGHAGQDTPAGMGQGFLQDYRQYVSMTDVDTHRVRFQPSDAGYPFTFRWIPADILAMCDSAIFVDEFGGFVVKVRMHVDNQAVVSNAALSTVFIIRYGEHPSGVTPISDGIPQKFTLDQNYPNPFNPSTTIRFAVQRLSKTDVTLFDVLGRKVATLVSEQLSPGYYSIGWSGRNDLGTLVSSGMYLLLMSAVDENNTTFSAVRKLMLTK